MALEIPAWLSKSKIGRELAEQEETEIRSVRKVLVQKKKSIGKKLTAELPTATRAVKDAEEECLATQAALEAAQDVLRQARLNRSSLTSTAGSEVSRIDAELRETADPAIDIFLNEVADLAEETKSRGFNGQRFASVEDVRKRLESLRNARVAVEAIQLEHHIDVAAELNKIRKTLATVGEAVLA